MSPAFLLRCAPLLLGLYLPAAQAADADAVRAVLASGQPTLLEFGADTCTQCKRMQTVLQALKPRFEGRAQVVAIDVNRSPELAQAHRIMVIPTVVLFDAQGKEAGRLFGFQAEDDLARRLEGLGAKP